MLLADFEDVRGVIEPGENVAANPDMPPVCIGVFSHVIAEEWVLQYQGAVMDVLGSAVGDRPIYKMNVGGLEFALFVPMLGGAGAGGQLEELIALGARQFVFTGCCGVLRHDIADGHLIVPTAALRGEGLSDHYVEAADEIELDGRLVEVTKNALDDLGLPYVCGKTWTTDAFYRETPEKVRRAKEMGAICVEMECASLAAVAQYRQVDFAQFLWSADNLDAPRWEKRGLGSNGSSMSAICLAAAVEIAKGMGRKPDGQ